MTDTIDKTQDSSNMDIVVDEKNITLLINEITQTADKVDQSIKKAAEAKKKAEEAHEIKPNLFNNNKVLESLQESGVVQAETLEQVVEAMTVAVDCITGLLKMCDQLFLYGISSIAENRTVVRSIRLKLENASKEELNDLARQELERVMRQLKKQEDLMLQVQHLDEKSRYQDQEIERLNDELRQAKDASLRTEKESKDWNRKQGLRTDRLSRDLDKYKKDQSRQLGHLEEKMAKGERGLQQEKSERERHIRQVEENSKNQNQIINKNLEEQSDAIELLKKHCAQQDQENLALRSENQTLHKIARRRSWRYSRRTHR